MQHFFLFCSIFPFSNEQVRIVLYRECDLNGRRLLFDSSAIQKVNLTAPTIIEDGDGNEKNQKNYIDISNGYGYRYARPETDYNSIGEMIFGSVAMSFRGTSLKVNKLPFTFRFDQYINVKLLSRRCTGSGVQIEYCARRCSFRQPAQMDIVAAAQTTLAMT